MRKELTEYTINYKGDQFYHVSGYTRPFLPITLNTNYRTVETAQWKLLPYWIKTEKEAEKLPNSYSVESESIFEKTNYKSYIIKLRGILWVDGFFEYSKGDGINKSESHYIYLPEKRIFSIGIIISPWLNTETGETINTFSVLTTKANDLLTDINNEKKRMPLIIPPDQRDTWLNATEEKEIKNFFMPFNGLLQAHKVKQIPTEQTNTFDIQKEIE